MKKVFKVFLLLICILPVVAVFSACGKNDESKQADYSIKASGISLEYTKVEYDGTAKEPSVTVTVGDTTLNEDDFSVSYSNNIEVGTAVVEVKAAEDSKYTGSAKVPFEITKIKVAAEEIILQYEYIMYSGEENTPSVSILHNDAYVPLEEYTVTYQNNVNAGTATVLVRAIEGSNYDININKTFEIAPLIYDEDTWEFSVEYESVEYDGEAKTPAVTIVVNGVTLVEGKDYTVTYYRNTNVGTASVAVESKEGSNYNFSMLIDFEITGELNVPEPELPEESGDGAEQGRDDNTSSGETESHDGETQD